MLLVQKTQDDPTYHGMAEGVKHSLKFLIYLAHNESMPNGDREKRRLLVQGPERMELEPVSTWAKRNKFAWDVEGGSRVCYNIYSTLWRAWCLFEVRVRAGPCLWHRRTGCHVAIFPTGKLMWSEDCVHAPQLKNAMEAGKLPIVVVEPEARYGGVDQEHGAEFTGSLQPYITQLDEIVAEVEKGNVIHGMEGTKMTRDDIKNVAKWFKNYLQNDVGNPFVWSRETVRAFCFRLSLSLPQAHASEIIPCCRGTWRLQPGSIVLNLLL